MEKKIKSLPIVAGRLTTCKICGHQWKFKPGERDNWTQNKMLCPVCKKLYCVLPLTERKLREIQDQYLIERSNKQIDEMFSILKNYAESIIKKKFIKSPHFKIDQLDEYAHDSATKVIEQFLIKKEFKIKKSFGKYLDYKIKERLFGKIYHDVGEESLDYKFEDGKLIEFEDNKNTYFNDLEMDDSKNNLCDYIVNLIFDIEDWCSCKKENYIRLLNVSNFLYYGENLPSKFFKLYKKEQNDSKEDKHLGKYIYTKTIDTVRLELLESLMQ